MKDPRNNPKITSQSHMSYAGDYLLENTVFREFDGTWISLQTFLFIYGNKQDELGKAEHLSNLAFCPGTEIFPR